MPNVFTITETGSATPMAYASCTSQREAELGRHQVLGDVARHVAGRAIDLRRILAAERAAAVTAHAAVGIHDDLAARQSRIAVRTADHKPAGRVDVVLGLLVHHVRRNDDVDDVLLALRSRSSSVETSGLCCVEITTASMRFGLLSTYSTRNLALAVGPQEVQHALARVHR